MPENGQYTQEIRDYVFTFASPGTQSKNIAGNIVFIYDCTGEFTLQLDDKPGILMRQSAVLKITEYEKITITTATTQTITVKAGFGDYSELSALVSIDPDTETLPTHPEQSNTIITSADVSIASLTAAQIIAADTTSTPRRLVHITNLETNTANFRIGDLANVGATRGKLLQPGETWITDNTAQIAGYNLHASSAQSLTIMVEDLT